MLPAIGTWGYPIRAYRCQGAMSVMFPIPRPHSSISEEFLHSIILRPKKPLGNWNLVNPLLRMNEASMDECAARLQPLVDQYKPRQHQTFAIEKFLDLIVTIMSRGPKNLFLTPKMLRFQPIPPCIFPLQYNRVLQLCYIILNVCSE